jgi:hypothetical protein
MAWLTSVRRAKKFTIKREMDKSTESRQEQYTLKQKKARFQELKLKMLGEGATQTKPKLKE